MATVRSPRRRVRKRDVAEIGERAQVHGAEDFEFSDQEQAQIHGALLPSHIVDLGNLFEGLESIAADYRRSLRQRAPSRSEARSQLEEIANNAADVDLFDLNESAQLALCAGLFRHPEWDRYREPIEWMASPQADSRIISQAAAIILPSLKGGDYSNLNLPPAVDLLINLFEKHKEKRATFRGGDDPSPACKFIRAFFKVVDPSLATSTVDNAVDQALRARRKNLRRLTDEQASRLQRAAANAQLVPEVAYEKSAPHKCRENAMQWVLEHEEHSIVCGWLVTSGVMFDKHYVVEAGDGSLLDVTPLAPPTPFCRHPGEDSEFMSMPNQIVLADSSYTQSFQVEFGSSDI